MRASLRVFKILLVAALQGENEGKNAGRKGGRGWRNKGKVEEETGEDVSLVKRPGRTAEKRGWEVKGDGRRVASAKNVERYIAFKYFNRNKSSVTPGILDSGRVTHCLFSVFRRCFQLGCLSTGCVFERSRAPTQQTGKLKILRRISTWKILQRMLYRQSVKNFDRMPWLSKKNFTTLLSPLFNAGRQLSSNRVGGLSILPLKVSLTKNCRWFELLQLCCFNFVEESLSGTIYLVSF